MAQKVQIILEDDVNGGPADETVQFALDGVSYEIDLSAANAAALRDALSSWIVAGRRTSGRKSVARTRRAGARGSDAAEIRAWAKETGLAVPDRGRIPAPIREAYTNR